MFVRGPKITGRLSLITRIVILSGPDDLSEGMNEIACQHALPVFPGTACSLARMEHCVLHLSK